jgi:cytochrome c oxidase subunit II
MVTNVLKKIIAGCALACSLLLSSAAYAVAGWNMPRGVTPISHAIYDLHMLVFWVCVAIGVVVFSVLIYALMFHRKSRGVQAASFHEHPLLELVWAIIPVFILIGLAIPATHVLVAMEDFTEADVTIKITGYQWKWKYDYLDENISFFSLLATPFEQIQNSKLLKNRWYLLEVNKPMVVPVDKKIRFLVTANDVIHSWWVPELGVKRDAIPGFIHEAWARIEKIGTYRGQCAELCGLNHAYMPIVVKAVSNQDYQAWVKHQRGEDEPSHAASAAAVKKPAKKWDKKALMVTGKKVYQQICAVCHKVDGTGQPPIFPAMRGSSVVVGKPIIRHEDIVLWGVKGTAMQAFADQLSDAEIAAVITYERNAFGNNTGDIVYPKDIAKRRQQKTN